jgi:hypothetical protein
MSDSEDSYIDTSEAIEVAETELETSMALQHYMQDCMRSELKQVAQDVVMGRLFQTGKSVSADTVLCIPKALSALVGIDTETTTHLQLQYAINTYLAEHGLAVNGTTTRLDRPLARAIRLDAKQVYHIVHVLHAAAAVCNY